MEKRRQGSGSYAVYIVGMCHINGTTLDDEPQMPFGGVKASGYGRSGGRAGLQEFTELQWVTIEGPQPPRYPIAE